MTTNAANSTAVMLTTCHVEYDGIDDLFRLIGSLEAALLAGEVQGLRLLVLLQGCDQGRGAKLAAELPRWVEIDSYPGRLSSSDARNQLLSWLDLGAHRNAPTFVAFPDDDAWYPPGSLGCIATQFARHPSAYLMLARYGFDASGDVCGQAHRASLHQALSHGACACLFVRPSALASVGGFSPLLGLGSLLRGGEDTEFVHRAFHHVDGRVMLLPGVLVGHAVADPVKKAGYYEGALAAMLAHRRASPAAYLAFLRKLAVGVYLVTRGRLRPGAFLSAIRAARHAAPALRALV